MSTYITYSAPFSMKNYTKDIQTALAANVFATSYDVLEALMSAYLEKSFFAKRHHTFLATRIINSIKASTHISNEERMRVIAREINTLSPVAMKQDGDMACLLKAFLSYYPDYIGFINYDLIEHVAPSAYGLADEILETEFLKIKKSLEPLEEDILVHASWDDNSQNTVYIKTLSLVMSLVNIATVSVKIQPAITEFLMSSIMQENGFYRAAIEKGIIALQTVIPPTQMEKAILIFIDTKNLKALNELKSVMPQHLICVLINLSILILEDRSQTDSPANQSAVDLLKTYLHLAPKAMHKELLYRIIELIINESMILEIHDLGSMLKNFLKFVKPEVITERFDALEFNAESCESDGKTKILKLMIPYINLEQKIFAMRAIIDAVNNYEMQMVSHECLLCIEILYEEVTENLQEKIVYSTSKYLSPFRLFNEGNFVYEIELTINVTKKFFETKAFKELMDLNYCKMPEFVREGLVNRLLNNLENSERVYQAIVALRKLNMRLLTKLTQYLNITQTVHFVEIALKIINEYAHHINQNIVERVLELDRSDTIHFALSCISELAKNIPANLMHAVATQLITLTDALNQDEVLYKVDWGYTALNTLDAIYPFITDNIVSETVADTIVFHRFKLQIWSATLENIIAVNPDRMPEIINQKQYIESFDNTKYHVRFGLGEEYAKQGLLFFKLLLKYTPSDSNLRLLEALIVDFYQIFYLNESKIDHPTWHIKLIESVYSILPQVLKKKLITLFFNKVNSCNNHEEVFMPIAKLIISDKDLNHMKANFITIQQMQLAELESAPTNILAELYQDTKTQITTKFLREKLNVLSQGRDNYELINIVDEHIAPKNR